MISYIFTLLTKQRHILYIFVILTLISPAIYCGVKDKKQSNHNPAPSIIFHPDYDIHSERFGILGRIGWVLDSLGIARFFGLSHSFDTQKYGKVAKRLQQECGITSFCLPSEVTNNQLLLVHSKEYLESLNNPLILAQIAELPPYIFTNMSQKTLQKELLHPIKLATGGTILGVTKALENRWAINLSGGYHHADAHCGGGFCYLADIPIAIRAAREKHPNLRVLIIDLDAHQGNGYARILKDDPNTFIYDIYVDKNYPHDIEARSYITYNYPVRVGINDQEYLSLLYNTLPAAIADSKPDLIIYNAGTDVFEKDPLGKMKISKAGIIQRDQFVVGQAYFMAIPILMVLSGGYTKESADIIADSIKNIVSNVVCPKSRFTTDYPLVAPKLK